MVDCWSVLYAFWKLKLKAHGKKKLICDVFEALHLKWGQFKKRECDTFSPTPQEALFFQKDYSCSFHSFGLEFSKQIFGTRLKQFRKEQAVFARSADPFYLDAEIVPAGFQLEIIELQGSVGMRRELRDMTLPEFDQLLFLRTSTCSKCSVFQNSYVCVAAWELKYVSCLHTINLNHKKSSKTLCMAELLLLPQGMLACPQVWYSSYTMAFWQ